MYNLFKMLVPHSQRHVNLRAFHSFPAHILCLGAYRESKSHTRISYLFFGGYTSQIPQIKLQEFWCQGFPNNQGVERSREWNFKPRVMFSFTMIEMCNLFRVRTQIELNDPAYLKRSLNISLYEVKNLKVNK